MIRSPRQVVEGKAKRVAQPESPGLLGRPRDAREWIRRRNAVGALPCAVRVDPEDLPVGGPERLRVAAVRVVTRRDVEVAVGAELKLSSVVVAGAVGEGPDGPAAREVGDVRVRADVELVDMDAPLSAPGVRPVTGVVDVEEPVRGIVGVEGHRQQAALAVQCRPRVDVEELTDRAVVENLDESGPLDDEEPRVRGRRGGEDGLVEARPDRLEAERRGARGHERQRDEAPYEHSQPDPGSHPGPIMPDGQACESAVDGSSAGRALQTATGVRLGLTPTTIRPT